MNSLDKNSKEQHKPWVKAGIALLAFLIVLSFFGSISQRLIVFKSEFLAEVIPRVLVDLTNRSRGNLALNQLTTSSVLEEVAQQKADDMAKNSYFAHTSPEGKTPWYWFGEAGYDFLYAGENLAIHFSDSPEVVRAWMNSPLHRANILNKNFTEVGIAISQGYFEGRRTVFVVQMFGKPKEVLAFNNQTNQEKKEVVTDGEIIEEGTSQIKETVLEDEGENKTIVAENITDINTEVLGEETVAGVTETETNQFDLTRTSAPAYSSFWERLSVSPTSLLTIVYVALAVVVVFLAILAILVEAKKHHYLHMIYALALLVLILILYFVSTNSLNEVEVLSSVIF